MNNTKMELSSEQREELLNGLRNRFEKNMNRHKDLEWTRVQSKLEANRKKLWSLDEMEITGGEPDVVGYDKKRMNIFFTIALPKALKAEEVFVTTMKHWSQGKNINQKTVPFKWLLAWALSF